MLLLLFFIRARSFVIIHIYSISNISNLIVSVLLLFVAGSLSLSSWASRQHHGNSTFIFFRCSLYISACCIHNTRFICLFRFQYLMFALNVIHRSSHSICFSCICLAHFFPKHIQHSFIHILRFRCWSLSMIIIFIGNVWILYAFWCRLTSTILQ